MEDKKTIVITQRGRLSDKEKTHIVKKYPPICKGAFRPAPYTNIPCAGEINNPCGEGLYYCGGMYDQIIDRLSSLGLSYDGIEAYSEDEDCPTIPLTMSFK